MGKIRRMKAKSIGMTLAEYNKLAETNPKTDIDVDKYQEQLGQKHDNFVIQGRTSWFFIPHSLKIFIDVDKTVGAQRVLEQLNRKNERNEDKNILTINDLKKSHAKRMACDKKRYKKYYNIANAFNKKHYDYVIDTTDLTKKQVFDNIYNFVKKKLNSK